MRLRAPIGIVVFLLAGCAEPAHEPAQYPTPPSIPADQEAPVSNVTQLPEPVPVREVLPTWVALNNCTEFDFGFPASYAQPADEWFPEGLQPSPLLGPIHSYNFFLWRCQDILVDNLTIALHAHMLIVETAVRVPDDHPHRGPYDQLMIQGYSDAPALVARLQQEGFSFYNATFHISEDGEGIEANIAGTGFRYALFAGPMSQGDNPSLALDVRMHTRAQETGAHLFFDLLRFPQGGAQEAAPRSAVAQVEAEWIDAPSQILGGIASAKPLHSALRVPVLAAPEERF